jgi:hypothetical protein
MRQLRNFRAGLAALVLAATGCSTMHNFPNSGLAEYARNNPEEIKMTKTCPEEPGAPRAYWEKEYSTYFQLSMDPSKSVFATVTYVDRWPTGIGKEDMMKVDVKTVPVWYELTTGTRSCTPTNQVFSDQGLMGIDDANLQRTLYERMRNKLLESK